MNDLKTLVVGAGDISQLWFPEIAARSDLDLVAVVELEPERARQRLAQASLEAPIATDLDAALARYRPDIVIDLTVPSARAEVVPKALRASCHVLVEKPLATDLDTARALSKLAHDRDVILMVSQNRRWDRNHVAVRHAIADGRIGQPVALYADFFVAAHFGGFRAEMRHPLLVDMAVHHLDLARFFSGSEPRWVFAEAFDPPGSWYQGAAAATLHAGLASGAHLSYRGSWVAEGFPTDANGHWRIVGSEGTILYERGAPPRLEVAGAGDDLVRPAVEEALAVPEVVEQQKGVLHAFVAAVRSGEPPPTAADDNLATLAFVLAAVRSADEGAIVRLEQR